MATVRDIVTQALQDTGVVGIGRTPRASEAQYGLEKLQSFYDELFSNGQFSALADVYATADYTAQENERIIADNATITIPDTITDGSETRTPNDLSVVVVITDTAQQNYVFSNGAWEGCHALTLDSPAPLSSRSRDGLAATLATRMTAFRVPIMPEIAAKATRFESSITRMAPMTFDAALTNLWLSDRYR